MFRLVPVPGHGPRVLPLELVPVLGHGAQISAQAPAKNYVQTGARARAPGTGARSEQGIRNFISTLDIGDQLSKVS